MVPIVVNDGANTRLEKTVINPRNASKSGCYSLALSNANIEFLAQLIDIN